MGRIAKLTRVSFHDAEGKLLDGLVVEHKLTHKGHRYRVRIMGSNRRLWLSPEDLVQP